MSSIGTPAHSATRRRSSAGGTVTVLGQRRRHRRDVEAVLGRVLRDDHRGENHRHVVARLARQELGGGSQLPEVVLAAAGQRALHAAGPTVIGRHREMPVLEHAVQRLQVLGGGLGGLDRRPTRSSRYQSARSPFSSAGRGHELPDAARLSARQRRRLERAFDQAGCRRGRAAGPRRGRSPESSAGTAPRATGLRSGIPAAVPGTARRIAGPDRWSESEYRGVVDCRSASTVSAVAGLGADDSKVSTASRASKAAGSDLVSEKPSPVASAACSRTVMRSTSRSKCSRRRAIAARAVRRLEQGVEREIELDFRALEVAYGQFFLPSLEMPVRGGDQDRNRIRCRLWNRRGSRHWRRRLWDHLDRCGTGTRRAACDQQGADELARRGGAAV